MDYKRNRDDLTIYLSPDFSGHAPVHLKINANWRTYAVVHSIKGIDMEALDNIQGIPVLDMNVESLEEKPWRRAGADISDYFNYGFDEHSWNAYCKKQTKLCAAHRKLYTKTRFQRGHTKQGKTEPSCFDSSSGTGANRESSATIDLTGGWPGSSSRVKHFYPSNEGNNTQVVTQMSPESDRITSYQLNSESNFSSLFTYTTPPPFLYQPGCPLLSLDSGHTKESDDPSSSLYPSLSGVSSLIPGSLVCSPGVISTAKAWEYVARCDKDRDRSRERVHDKDSKKESESCSSLHNSGEGRIRHRDTMEREHKQHSFERVSGEEGQHIERRQKSSQCSSSRRRESGEDRESQGRHKHKKAKRNRKKNKKIDKMSSSDPERKLKCD